MSQRLLLCKVLLSLTTGLLLSCGGGGGDGGAGSGAASAFGTGAGAVVLPGPDGTGSPGGAGDGIGGIGADDGSSTTASSGGDGSGVGSGGTGVSTADATGVGSVDGAGSIIVNGLRYDTRGATGRVEDAPNGLQLGMSAKVVGPVNAEFTQGIARTVESAADIRGPVASVDQAQGSFVMLGTTVTTDEATVWADASGLTAISAGQTLQVWGLPAAPGVLRATRIEQRGPSGPILVGTVRNHDAAQRSFTLNGIAVDYSGALPAAILEGRPLVDGTLVRVRAGAPVSGNRLVATQVQAWYPVPAAAGSIAQLAGVVADFAGLGAFRLLGLPVDASAAQITGGLAGAIGNGVKVEVGGVVSDGVLRASKLKIRNVPGAGGPASFDLTGAVGAFRSAADFRVRGQPVDASGPGVVFANGTAASLGNGVRVRVQGARVVNGVLTAQVVTFQ